MQNKILIIQQYFGLGDVIWGQTIAQEFIHGGYKVLWPVLSSLTEGLNRAYPDVMFIDHTMLNIDYENKAFKEVGGIRYLPMRYSESLMGKPYRYHMESKYSFLGMDWKRWREHAMPQRDLTRERFLRDVIGADEPYNLIATKFGNNGQSIEIRQSNDFKNIYLDVIEDYSLFDWCGIIENATTIHAVSSSTLYLFELLNLRAKEVHLYPRQPYEQNFDYTKFLMTKKYILHE